MKQHTDVSVLAQAAECTWGAWGCAVWTGKRWKGKDCIGMLTYEGNAKLLIQLAFPSPSFPGKWLRLCQVIFTKPFLQVPSFPMSDCCLFTVQDRRDARGQRVWSRHGPGVCRIWCVGRPHPSLRRLQSDSKMQVSLPRRLKCYDAIDRIVLYDIRYLLHEFCKLWGDVWKWLAWYLLLCQFCVSVENFIEQKQNAFLW